MGMRNCSVRNVSVFVKPLYRNGPKGVAGVEWRCIDHVDAEYRPANSTLSFTRATRTCFDGRISVLTGGATMCTQREMNLDEYVGVLPSYHCAAKEYAALKAKVAAEAGRTPPNRPSAPCCPDCGNKLDMCSSCYAEANPM